MSSSDLPITFHYVLLPKLFELGYGKSHEGIPIFQEVHLDQRNLLLLATQTIEHSPLFQIQDMTKFFCSVRKDWSQ